MQTYAELATSQAAWLGSLPSHWECKKIGALFSERKTKVSDKDYAPLSVTKVGIVPQLANAAKTDAGDNRKLVCSGDFVINSRSDRKGSCGVSKLDGSVSLINVVLTPRNELNKKYVHYLFRCQPFSEEYYRNGRGIVADLWTTRYSEMKSILLPVPSREEQDQIVRFLDWKVSAINRLITIQEKQIKILLHLIQSEIEQQLQQYPIEKIVRLKQLGSFSKGGGFSRENLTKTKECPAILYGDIYTQYEYRTSVISHHIDRASYDSSRKIRKGDIVMTGTGETKDEIGKPILYDGEELVAVGGDVIVFHPNEGVFSDYILFQLYGYSALKHRYENGKGDIIVHIYPSSLGNTEILLPNQDNQKRAVAHIQSTIEKARGIIKLKKNSIAVLREFRERLVSDVVTGKIDVRGIEVPEYGYVAEDVPNSETMEAIAEVAEMKAHPENYRSYATFQELLDDVTADSPSR